MDFQFEKMILRSAFLLFLGLTLSAFQIERTSSNRLILSEENCDKAKKTSSDFSNWKKSSDGEKGCDPNALRYEPNSRSCTVDTTDCLPEHVQKYQGVAPELAGPNCWNTALVMAKILPNHRYTSEYEFSYYMRPPLCRALKNDEERRAGDVGAIRKIDVNGQLQEKHAFIYVNEQIVYSKSSWGDMFPYMLLSTNGMYREFNFTKDSACTANQSNTNCPVSTTYFRCQSMDEYLSKSTKNPDELLQIFHSVGNFDSCVENYVNTNSALTAEAIKNLKDTGAALAQYLKEQLGKTPKPVANSEEQFMLGALHVRLFSLAEQLKILKSNPEEKEFLYKLSNMISASR